MGNTESSPADDGASFTEIVARFDDITKPLTDEAEYRGLELANGMRILLATDPKVTQSEAYMSVNVGDLMDPVELVGLANLCKKMLFLASKKYPEENSFRKFLAEHGGSTRCWSNYDTTNSFFEVGSDYLKEALDRWIQFFADPLLAEDSVEREINGLDNEFQSYYNIDYWRVDQIQHVMATPDHDWGKPPTANKRTLMDIPAKNGIDVKEGLKKFYEKHYSANLMTCLIVDKRPLDELEKLIEESDFCKVVDKNLDRKIWEEKPYGPDQLGHRVDVVPIRDTKELQVHIPVDDLSQHKSNPFHYVSHLIFNQHDGGFHAELKKRGWVNAREYANGWIHSKARGIAFLTATISLTDEGLQHVEEIIELFFHLVGSIKASGVQQWLHDELANIGKIKFSYSEQNSHFHVRRTLAKRLHTVPFKNVLSMGELIEEFNPELIQDLLGQLTPQNMNYFVICKEAESLKNLVKEEHLGALYKKAKIDEYWMERFEKALVTRHEAFHLPEKNEFVPSRFDMKPRDCEFTDVPKIIHNDDFLRTWFVQNDDNLPKATIFILLRIPKTDTDPVNRLMTRIFAECFNQSISSETGYLKDLGMWSHIFTGDHGTQIYLTGFDDKLPTFIKSEIQKFRAFKVDEKSFNVALESITQSFKNFGVNAPFDHAWDSISHILNEQKFSISDYQAACDNITFNKLNAFIPQLWEAFHVEILGYGNLTQSELLDLSQEVTRTLKGSKPVLPPYSSELQGTRQLKIKEGTFCGYEIDQDSHDDSCLIMHLQIGPMEIRTQALLELFDQMVEHPIDDALRHKEQLGAMVHAFTYNKNGVLNLQINVEGGFDVRYVNERIEAFLKDFRATIINMTDKEFSNHIEALTVKLLNERENRIRLAWAIWSEICNGHFMFKRREILAKELKTISKEDVLKFYDEKISAESTLRQKLSVRVRSTTKKGKIPEGHVFEEDDKEILIKNIEQFKSTLEAYPLPQPATINVPRLGQ
ncbi:hypothetical protein L596_022023 [Steinernema carpocapsae]|uniref:Peptidase M16 middle/third domain-containing protein n=1 Tax=Steinernema carpocapsae TaxID=34508 RepID=A0A4U5MKI8_STECR|nr:hypothetical protein L596_022023 [Steinernema carpocapsae]